MPFMAIPEIVPSLLVEILKVPPVPAPFEVEVIPENRLLLFAFPLTSATVVAAPVPALTPVTWKVARFASPPPMSAVATVNSSPTA